MLCNAEGYSVQTFEALTLSPKQNSASQRWRKEKGKGVDRKRRLTGERDRVEGEENID